MKWSLKWKSLSHVWPFATPRNVVHGIFQARIMEWIAFPSPGDLPNPGIKPRSPTLQADSLPTEPQGKPKNTGVGNLPLLQQIFPSQETNRGLLHCRWILYQLSYWCGVLHWLIFVCWTPLIPEINPTWWWLEFRRVLFRSLLQQIFPTQEVNRGLLHCRWILYQLSYQGSPDRDFLKSQ